MTSSTRPRLDGQHGAELVAAEPVGLAVGRDLGGQLGAQAGEQRVAGGMAEGVVVGLEAVEVEEHQQARGAPRPWRTTRPGCAAILRRLPRPVRGSLIACSRSAWWPRMSAAAVAALGDELGQQLDLVGLERARAARDADGAVGRRAGDAERQRERPAGGVRRSAAAAPLAAAASPRRRSATPRSLGRVLGQAARRGSRRGCRQPASASSASIEPRSMMSTSASRSSLAANASPMRRTAACSRLRSRTATRGGAGPARCACAGRAASSRSSPASGRTSRTREDGCAGGVGGQKADRRQAGVDEPHEREARGAAACGATPRAAASRSVAEPASNRQQASNAAPSSGRLPRSSCGAPASRARARARRRATRRGRRRAAQRGAAPADQVRERARAPGRRRRAAGRWPAAAARASGPARAAMGRTLPAPTGNSTPRDERVERDEHDRERRVEPGRGARARAAARRRRAGTARRPRSRSGARGGRHRASASPRSPRGGGRRRRRCGCRRRCSVHVGLSVAGCERQAPVARAAPGPPAAHGQARL